MGKIFCDLLFRAAVDTAEAAREAYDRAVTCLNDPECDLYEMVDELEAAQALSDAAGTAFQEWVTRCKDKVELR